MEKIMRFHVLHEFIMQNNFKKYVEIGLGKGMTVEYLLKNIKDPEFRMYGVDPFLTYPELRKNNAASLRFIRTMHRNEGLVAAAVNGDPRFTLVKKMSDDASLDFEHESLDLVFIDGNHSYEYVLRDMENWTPLVRKGGIVAGHDYATNPKSRYYDVQKAVHEFGDKHGYEILLAPNYVWYFYKS